MLCGIGGRRHTNLAIPLRHSHFSEFRAILYGNGVHWALTGGEEDVRKPVGSGGVDGAVYHRHACNGRIVKERMIRGGERPKILGWRII